MAKIDLYSPQWVEMVFEGRNKEYGAYKLRKNIGKRNVLAIIIMLVAAVVIGGGIAINIQIEKAREHEAYLAELEASRLAEEQAKKEAEKKKDEPKVQPKVEPEKIVEQKRQTVQYTAPVIKPDNEVKKQINLQDIEKKMDEGAAAGAQDQEGTTERNMEGAKLAEVVAAPEPPKEEPKVVEKEVEEKILTVAEQQPSFKGNLNQWLSQNLQYPASAAESGIEGRVVVKFVVGKDGSVSQAQVVRGVDPALDREALRVVSMMPKWNPGMNNGQPVKVWYNLPVSFKLQH